MAAIVGVPATLKAGAARRGGDIWAALAGLRFFLASVVVAVHMGASVSSGSPFGGLAQFGGYAAVLGFFVVSGYSIRHSLDREPAQFGARRFWRIYPSFFVAVCLSTVPFLLFGPAFPGPGGAVEAPLNPYGWVLTFFMAGRLFLPILPTDIPLWSIGLECAYYALSPLFLRMPQRRVVWVALASAAFCFYYSYNAASPLGGGATYWTRYVAFVWAYLAGFLYDANRGKVWAQLLLFAPGPLFVALGEDSRLGSVTMLLVAGLLHYGPRLALPRWSVRPLNYLGDLSFPLYLLHCVVIYTLYPALTYHPVPWLTRHPGAPAFLYYGAALLAAALLYHLVDAPARALGRRRVARARHQGRMAYVPAPRAAVTPPALPAADVGADRAWEDKAKTLGG